MGQIPGCWTWQHRPGVFYPQAQLSEHLHGGDLAVQRVEVEAGHPAAVQEHAAHLHRLVDAVVTDGSVVVFDGLDDLGDLLWHLELRQLDELTQGLVTLERNRLKSSFTCSERLLIDNRTTGLWAADRAPSSSVHVHLGVPGNVSRLVIDVRVGFLVLISQLMLKY